MKRLWKTMAMVGLLAGLAAGMCPAAEMGQDRAVSGEGLQKGEIVYTDGVAIGNVTAHQRFPWNGLVDIDYEVFCLDPDAEVWVYPVATDGEHGCVLSVETLSGDGAGAPVKAGRHRMTWDAKADNPGAHSTALSVKMRNGNKSVQTISFTAIGEPTWQDRVELSATASSGGAVTFKVLSGPGNVDGNVLTFTGGGTVKVWAGQVGDDQWFAASATQTVTVAKVAQTVSFAAVGVRLSTERVALSATATGGGTVTFEMVSGPGVVEGNVLTFTGEGTVEVRAVQAGDERWLPASATQTVTVIDEKKILYMVLDLSAGSGEGAVYPVSYLTAEPEGGWTDEYKTTKLVLRRIEPGTFMMGGEYQTTLTKPYYMGVFEVTQKQYELVTGGNPSWNKGDMRPVVTVSWNKIRGNTDWPASSAVSADSFMGRLRARTGLEFDLPTEAQWEYACRAGTTSDYNNGGNSEDDLKQLGRYADNQRDGKGGYSDVHTTVGSYLPNAWGLYDMHGNVWEWCLDWYGRLANGATDPEGWSSGSTRVLRGGSWRSDAGDCTSSYRGNSGPSYAYSDNGGIRLVRTLSN